MISPNFYIPYARLFFNNFPHGAHGASQIMFKKFKIMCRNSNIPIHYMKWSVTTKTIEGTSEVPDGKWCSNPFQSAQLCQLQELG